MRLRAVLSEFSRVFLRTLGKERLFDFYPSLILRKFSRVSVWVTKKA